MKGRQQNTFRIIGGSHRGRRFSFPAGQGDQAGNIRPSPDRVRETLFNWLAPLIHGSRCLDAFAGSGALGIEALSRGAAYCRFIERDRAALDAIRGHLETLRMVEKADLRLHDALRELQQPADQCFDIVFLDPPYAAGLLPEAMQLLESGGWLAPDARIYMECSSRDTLPELPANWQLEKSRKAGDVAYHLIGRGLVRREAK